MKPDSTIRREAQLMVTEPEKLSGTARSFGDAWRTLNQFREQAEHEVQDIVSSFELPTTPVRPSHLMTNFNDDYSQSSMRGYHQSLDDTDGTNNRDGRMALNQNADVIPRAEADWFDAKSRNDVVDVDDDFEN